MLKKSDLHPYQANVLKLGKNIPHLGMFFAPGLGKSVTTLTIIEECDVRPVLIVAPKRVAESVWAQECEKWEHLSNLKVSKILGTPKQRKEALKTPADIYVTNLENVLWMVIQPEFKKFKCLVLDESSRWKDPQTRRFKELKKHLKQFDRRIILTGTPTPQSVADLWSQVGILDLGERLETSQTKFRAKYMHAGQRNRHTNVVYKWELNDGANETILSKVSDICFSLKAEDYLQLPKLSKIYHKIILNEELQLDYKTLKKDMVLNLGDTIVTSPTAGVLVNKLLQFTSGALYTEDGDWKEIHTAKLEFLTELLESVTHPTIIFYHFKHSLERLKDTFPNAVVLDDSKIQNWRDGKIKILLAHPQSGGIGLNLQCNVGEVAQEVWYDLPWSSENYIQANARVYRQGQTKPVIIHHLVVGDSVDERVVDVLEGKIKVQDAVMDELKMNHK